MVKDASVERTCVGFPSFHHVNLGSGNPDGLAPHVRVIDLPEPRKLCYIQNCNNVIGSSKKTSRAMKFHQPNTLNKIKW